MPRAEDPFDVVMARLCRQQRSLDMGAYVMTLALTAERRNAIQDAVEWLRTNVPAEGITQPGFYSMLRELLSVERPLRNVDRGPAVRPEKRWAVEQARKTSMPRRRKVGR